MKKPKTIVVHSGGMDSSICLALAIREFGVENVLSLSFSYQQRHSIELQQAKKICQEWGVEHTVLSINCLDENALTNPEIPIEHQEGKAPNTLVVGRNGLMARLAAIHAHNLGVHTIYMGVIEVEEYRDCSRAYMDLKQQILRIDLDDPLFEIRTPLVNMTKCETLEVADQLNLLSYLLDNTVTCYEGIMGEGCKVCPACKLRNQGIMDYMDISERPESPLFREQP